ncbi:arabinose ABC transporter permease [Pandoraea cepalis]|uniref:Arabinose ABC transporter permease n=1 Tax=Pandoraea cepalis TaxID=2508294 RepID=A0AAW7MNS1_9BURK|nr:MFS transporter [Pandoraea cepalis]MDN4574281.1 arabinose ABC transporter permease [Pandoraea cepalis]MDN4579784.1 arabinose ABC transporter permease [Pandoraea cepalis]
MGKGVVSREIIACADNNRALLFAFSISVFFVGASEFMLAAMLSPLGIAFGTDSTRITWLISSYAFAYAIAAPLLGYLADRVNRSRLLLVALLLFAIDGIGIAFSPTLEIAIALRIFGGLASAVIIPTAFALISEVVPRTRHASAMGAVMLGMTFGIALGPAMAGLLTIWVGWRAPFLLTSTGCIIAFIIGAAAMPHRRTIAAPRKAHGFRWLLNPNITRPLLAKGLWNGTGVSAFLLSGEVLRQRYQLDVAHVGISVTTFGVGLGVGNLSAARLQRLTGYEERSLIVVTVLLIASVAAFNLLPLPMSGALVCLTLWGAALGAGAPSATTVLADRANSDKGAVLATAETLNNIVILSIVPLASTILASGSIVTATSVFVVALSIGAALTFYDALVAPQRNP